ncbi:SH3 domain-containing protein [Acidipropionibacterium jensenii]|uniref:SH3 domain-containing protein n=1 Tax=Acidipropionibacterium jensenii TaxID=1749 RepID=UPI0015861F3D|nr:SH3 domain-containing protein [Acidipropionibacterium jensenii]
MTDYLNVRSGPSASLPKVATLTPGQQIRTTSRTANGYQQVVFQGRTRWVQAKYLTDAAPASSRTLGTAAVAKSTRKVTASAPSAAAKAPSSVSTALVRGAYLTDNVNLRSAAGTDQKSLGILPAHSYLTLRGATVDGWAPVSAAGHSGWVKAAFLSTTKPAAIVPASLRAPSASTPAQTAKKASATKSAAAKNAASVRRIVYASVGVNVRSGAGTAYRVVGQLSQGDYVGTRGAAVGGWTPVSFQGKAGWVKSSLLSTSKPKVSASSAGSAGSVRRIVYASVGVNVRSGAGTAYRVVGQLSQGDYVGTRGAAVGGWTPVSFQGKAGWVKSSLLSTSKPKVSASSAGSAGSVRRIVYASVGVNVRSGAGTAYRVVGQLSQGDYVGTRGAAVGGWTPVSFQGKAGWVKSSLLSTSKPKVSATSSRTNASSVSGTVTSTTPRSYSSVPSSGGVDPWGFYWGQCVSYVAWQVRSNTGHSNFQNMYRGVHFGNAENWGSAARSLGITVNSTPTVGSVAWRTSGSAGHVAYVTAVHSNGTIDVSEYNYLVTSGFDTRSNVNWQSGGSSGFDGFIHF